MLYLKRSRSWNVDWNRRFVIDVLGLSKFGNLSYSPYENYIRILYEIYGEDIEIEENLKSEEVYERRKSSVLKLWQAIILINGFG